MSGVAQLDTIKDRRQSLENAQHALTEALSQVRANESAGLQLVQQAAEHANAVLEDHIEQTEAPGSIFENVIQDAPHLENKVRGLRHAHLGLKAKLDMVRKISASAIESTVEAAIGELEMAAFEFLDALTIHRHQGAELLYQAYQVDLGGHN